MPDGVSHLLFSSAPSAECVFFSYHVLMYSCLNDHVMMLVALFILILTNTFLPQLDLGRPTPRSEMGD